RAPIEHTQGSAIPRSQVARSLHRIIKDPSAPTIIADKEPAIASNAIGQPRLRFRIRWVGAPGKFCSIIESVAVRIICRFRSKAAEVLLFPLIWQSIAIGIEKCGG